MGDLFHCVWGSVLGVCIKLLGRVFSLLELSKPSSSCLYCYLPILEYTIYLVKTVFRKALLIHFHRSSISIVSRRVRYCIAHRTGPVLLIWRALLHPNMTNRQIICNECDSSRPYTNAIFQAHTRAELSRQRGEGRRARRARDVWWGSPLAQAPATSTLNPSTATSSPKPLACPSPPPIQQGLPSDKEKVNNIVSWLCYS